MTTQTTKKLSLPLPHEMHAALFDEARRVGIPATRLARSAIEDWLEKQKRERRREEIRRFAQEHANTEYDLDPALESAAADQLQEFDGGHDETR